MERLQKILAAAGIASRRKAEELIREGRVELNGKKVTELGTKADPANDLIRVDGRAVAEPQDKVWHVLYKPAGCVTTLSDPEGRATIARYLKGVPERVYPVGRLDYDVEGALLITNDGDLAHQLMHPKFGVRRTYLAKVSGHLDGPATERLLGKLLGGMRLEDGRAKALEADIHSRTPKNTWVRVVVSEGRQHLVKRLMETAGAPVVKLFRSDYGGIDVQGLRPGELRELTRAEMDLLRSHEAKRPKGASAEAGEPGRSGAKASAKRPGKPAPATAPRPFVGLPARRHGHGPPEPAGRRGQRRKR